MMDVVTAVFLAVGILGLLIAAWESAPWNE